MSDAREVVLGRVRAALGEVSGTSDGVVRAYRRRGDFAPQDVVALFCDRLSEYRADVRRVTDVRAAIDGVLTEQRAHRVGIALDLDAGLRPSGVDLVEDRLLDTLELDGLDAALTTCAAACAETGTIALDGGPGQGRRALTLLPDLHVCLVRPEQVVQTVPELLERLAPSARVGRPIVLVSGPSATSDIELQRVEGVHGPRRLVVLVSGL